MINSGKGMGDSQIGAVGVRRELHVLLLLDLSLLVEAQQIGDRVAEDDCPERQDQRKLNEAERRVGCHKTDNQKVSRNPTDQRREEYHRPLAPNTVFLRGAPK